ncbi:Glutathione S-transferase (GstA) (PDB:1A0F) [Commensalibacter communis]|uniref:FtsZ-binding protein FzlA n=1 Tax=Commensalibacter communis TaxID=2972786 RepID=UPI0022FF9938|nr:glutathione S-transferase family protein [Commensalibacter communis]CAI3927412.1 Glutathione S-transferase (GstA) (PDB:1A0F) [Commensalibacter communis]CAI3931921.1 Glutathione S-transferase (GstA) (PDB:1A0F) [Commensalibacter communis]
MRILYHLPLCPFSRKIRLIMAEKRLSFELMTEMVWKRRPEFIAINPAGMVPVLVEETGLTIPDSYAICEYLEEAYPDTSLMGRTLAERVEVRRLTAWFDCKFNREVTHNLLYEKTFKRFFGNNNPNAQALREGYENIKFHLNYIALLTENRVWLAGSNLSMADFAAAAHLSSLDYIGDVNWEKNPAVKDWYARIKSRPSFRALLNDRVSGVIPPKHYADLDF